MRVWCFLRLHAPFACSKGVATGQKRSAKPQHLTLISHLHHANFFSRTSIVTDFGRSMGSPRARLQMPCAAWVNRLDELLATHA